MSPRLWSSRREPVLASVLAVGAVVAGVLAGSGSAQAATSLPCDIYAAAGTPCVAAHSTVRALYARYTGALYQVHRYLAAMVKGEPSRWAIRGGNAQSGGLSTFYSGPRPNVAGYNPMHKEGAIILGIGGDNSKGSAGTFYEGVLTSGYPSDSTQNAVQAEIVSARFGR